MTTATSDILAMAGTCVDLAYRQVKGPWLRASPLLLRQAVESAVTNRVQTIGVSADASMRAKLLCLSELDGQTIGAEATWLWERLSDCCHYGAYELDPTLPQLTDWANRCTSLSKLLGSVS